MHFTFRLKYSPIEADSLSNTLERERSIEKVITVDEENTSTLEKAVCFQIYPFPGRETEAAQLIMSVLADTVNEWIVAAEDW